eukprot:968844-Rhodomonas_salina.1
MARKLNYYCYFLSRDWNTQPVRDPRARIWPLRYDSILPQCSEAPGKILTSSHESEGGGAAICGH